jgi:hypothetical protein
VRLAVGFVSGSRMISSRIRIISSRPNFTPPSLSGGVFFTRRQSAFFEPARVNSHPPLPRDSLPVAMSRRQIGIAVALVGVVAALIAALANPLGIGDPGWGWKQTVLLVVGIVLVICGGVIALRSPSSGTGVAPPAP